MDEANLFLKETFIPAHNARFAIKLGEPGSAFVPFATTRTRRWRYSMDHGNWPHMTKTATSRRTKTNWQRDPVNYICYRHNL